MGSEQRSHRSEMGAPQFQMQPSPFDYISDPAPSSRLGATVSHHHQSDAQSDSPQLLYINPSVLRHLTITCAFTTFRPLYITLSILHSANMTVKPISTLEEFKKIVSAVSRFTSRKLDLTDLCRSLRTSTRCSTSGRLGVGHAG